MRSASVFPCFAASIFLAAPCAIAQSSEPAPTAHVQAHDPSSATTVGWTWQADGVLFGTFNHQGGRRGGTDWRSQNWLMGMGSRPMGAGVVTVAGMVTLEPVTAGGRGYASIFQAGEAYRGLPIVDRQHPHDVISQIAVAWTRPARGWSVTLVGAPVGEATLGPPAFMHRGSAVDNPVAPLSHHIFDSTHVASSVAAGRAQRGRVALEAAVFHGREPDEHRYGIGVGAWDSWSARVWLSLGPEWTMQASRGFLNEVEELEAGDQRRTSMSASWLRRRTDGYLALTAAVGWNQRTHSTSTALLIEAAARRGASAVYLRGERVGAETETLLFPQTVHVPHPGELVDPVGALTAGGVRDLWTMRGVAVGVGGDVTTYFPPPLLRVTHGRRPSAFHVFFRIARASTDHRMLESTMASHGSAHQHR
ncbi:MAG: hypothetical protein ABL986_17120 [Vicinamibacterales bacterium]